MKIELTVEELKELLNNDYITTTTQTIDGITCTVEKLNKLDD